MNKIAHFESIMPLQHHDALDACVNRKINQYITA